MAEHNKIRVIITNKQKAVKIPTGIRMLVRRCCNAVLRLEKFCISLDDILNKAMTDNILFIKETGADIINVLEDFDTVFKTALCTVRKVNLCNIARDYHF